MNLEQLNAVIKGSGQAGRELHARSLVYQQIKHEETKSRYLFLYLSPIFEDCLKLYDKEYNRVL